MCKNKHCWDRDLLFIGYYEFIYLGLLQFKQISYPLKFSCAYVIMPFTKATQGLSIERELLNNHGNLTLS